MMVREAWNIAKGWRMLAFAMLLAALGAAEQFDWGSVIPEKYEGLALMGIGLIVAWLRKITDTPIGKKEPLK